MGIDNRRICQVPAALKVQPAGRIAMPALNGQDQITFYVIVPECRDALSNLRASYPELTEEWESENDAEFARIEKELGRISRASFSHGLTIYPEGNPQLRYYAEKYDLVPEGYDYDVSDYLDVLYGDGVTLREFPLCLINHYDQPGRQRLSAAIEDLLGQGVFPNEEVELRAVLAALAEVEAEETLVLWYDQWA